MRLLEAFANIFRVPDLRKRVLFTLGLLAVYRLGGQIPTPGINIQRVAGILQLRDRARIFGFFDMFAGGNIRRLTIFALGIMPYITASIILQLLTVVVPTLEKLQKEGELGPPQDHAVDPLPDDDSLGHSVGHHRRRSAVHGAGHRHQPRLRLRAAHRAFADHRFGVHHVAGRADLRTRRGQRHVADHLHRHRGGPAARDRRTFTTTPS